MSRTHSRRRSFAALLVGTALGSVMSAGTALLLYTGQGFLRAAGLLTSSTILALAAGLWAGAPERDEPSHTRGRWLVCTLAYLIGGAFVALIDGCRQDMVKTRYETFEELLHYCELVATSISDISLSIFGYRTPMALEYGRSLSTALQLTNVTRDIGEATRAEARERQSEAKYRALTEHLPTITSVEVMGEAGYEGASMRDMAARAGVSVAALYHHFPSKLHLLREFLEEAYDVVLARIERRLLDVEPTPPARLDEIVATLIASLLHNEFARLAANVAWREHTRLPPPERSTIDETRDRLLDLVAEVVGEGVASGDFTVDEPREAARAIVTLSTSLVEPFGEMGRSMSEVISTVSGIGTPGSSRRFSRSLASRRACSGSRAQTETCWPACSASRTEQAVAIAPLPRIAILLLIVEVIGNW